MRFDLTPPPSIRHPIAWVLTPVVGWAYQAHAAPYVTPLETARNGSGNGKKRELQKRQTIFGILSDYAL